MSKINENLEVSVKKTNNFCTTTNTCSLTNEIITDYFMKFNFDNNGIQI